MQEYLKTSTGNEQVRYHYPAELKRHSPYLALPLADDSIAYITIARCACKTMRLAVCNIRADGKVIDLLPQGNERRKYYRTFYANTAALRARAEEVPTFTFVRNPYDRLMSFYARRRVAIANGYYRTIGIGDRFGDRFDSSLAARLKRAARKSMAKFVEGPLMGLDRWMTGRAAGRDRRGLIAFWGRLPEPGPDTLQEHFNEFVKKFVAVPFQELDNHIIHQNLFIRDSEGIFVDFVGNLEKVQEQWPLVESLAGRNIWLPYVGERSANFVQPKYTPETQRLVYEYFKSDFEILGYGFECDKVAQDMHTDTTGVVVRGYSLPADQVSSLRQEMADRNGHRIFRRDFFASDKVHHAAILEESHGRGDIE